METPASLAFELKAVLVECAVNVLVSTPDRFKTIIHLDIVGVETDLCGFTKFNRRSEFCPLISFGLSSYKSIHRQTQTLILLKDL